jgi:hypothetical protein
MHVSAIYHILHCVNEAATHLRPCGADTQLTHYARPSEARATASPNKCTLEYRTMMRMEFTMAWLSTKPTHFRLLDVMIT